MRQISVDSVTESCYRLMKEDILSGKLVWGQRLDVPALSLEFRVSRSPIMDAIARLAHEGLVVVEARRGSFVAQPSTKDIAELTQVRAGLELLALEFAFPSLTTESLDRLDRLVPDPEEVVAISNRTAFLESDRRFHDTLVGLADNSRLASMVEMIRVQVDLFRVDLLTPEAAQRATGTHRNILAALRRKDLAEAQSLLKAHIQFTGKRAIDRLIAPSSSTNVDIFARIRPASQT